MDKLMVDKINNYKLRDFLKKDEKLIEEYATMLSFIEPIPTKNELFYMPLEDVDFIKRSIAKIDLPLMVAILEKCNDLSEEEVMAMPIVSFYGNIRSVKLQLDKILTLEEEKLSSSVPNLKWESVDGSKRLSPFGIHNTLDKLSGGDILKWDAIKKLPYDLVFVKLFMDRVRGDIDYEMSKIKTKQ